MTTMTAANSPSGLVMSEILSEDFWKDRFPKLSISRRSAAPLQSQQRPHQQPLERIHERMMEDGYFGDSDAALIPLALALAEGVKTCVSMGLPPVFIFLCDEVWECFFRLHPVISHLLGDGYKFLPAFWVWHVDPKNRESGWRPHRDRGSIALAPDGSPFSLSLWIPLSDANPLNSCIYVVPSGLDPTYDTKQENTFQASPVTIRALPAKPGDYLCWNQSVYHWGSPSSPFATEPRISMSLECQRGDILPFDNPLLEPLSTPDFPVRLRLVAKQILQYQRMYGFSQELCEIATRIIEANQTR